MTLVQLLEKDHKVRDAVIAHTKGSLSRQSLENVVVRAGWGKSSIDQLVTVLDRNFQIT